MPSRRSRLLLGAAGVALLLATPAFGQSPVRFDYREPVQPDGLATDCYPLPGGVELDLTYVLRRDGEAVTARGVRRLVLVHVDRLGYAEARERVLTQFAEAGVAGVTVSGGDFDVPDDALVQSWLRLDLPPTAVTSTDPVCGADYVTKRYLPDIPDKT